MRDHSHSNRATLVVADNGADDGVEGWPSDLKWSQFDPLPRRPDKVKEDAKTATSVTAGEDVNIEHDRKGFKLGAFKVPLTFDSSKSWVVNGKTDAPLLRHEQVHWDIAGLNAHELARALKAIRTAKPGGLRGAIDSNFSRLEIKGQAQQLWYDGESKHGLDAAGQKKWQDLVQNAIDGGNLPLPDPPQKYVDEAKKLKAAGEL
jgi:hypothetical protein